MNTTSSMTQEEGILAESIDVINKFVQFLLKLYDDFGIDGMHDLVDPDLDTLESIVKNLQQEVDKLPINPNDFSLENKKISLAQGLLYAQSMITNVRNKDTEECSRNRSMLENNQSSLY